MTPRDEAAVSVLGRRAEPAGLEARRGRRWTAAISTAGAWLLEPAEPEPRERSLGLAAPRPVVAVFGLARGCGTTVVARALAAELAARDPGGAAAVACEAEAGGIPLATRAAAQLARALAAAPGVATRAVGRLCLVDSPDQLALADSSRLLAPLVLDAGSTSLGGASASLADRTVLVATPAVEPALTRVATECLRRLGVEPVVVTNRARRTEPAEPVEVSGSSAASGVEPAGADHRSPSLMPGFRRARRSAVPGHRAIRSGPALTGRPASPVPCRCPRRAWGRSWRSAAARRAASSAGRLRRWPIAVSNAARQAHTARGPPSLCRLRSGPPGRALPVAAALAVLPMQRLGNNGDRRRAAAG